VPFPVLTGWPVDHFFHLPVFTLAAVMPPAGSTALFVVGHRRSAERAGGMEPVTC